MKQLRANFPILSIAVVLSFLFFLTDRYLSSLTYPLIKRETEKAIGEVEEGWDVAFIKGLKKKTLEATAKKKEKKKKSITPKATALLSALRVDKSPIIDGKLDDSCWKKAQKADNFICWRGGRLAEEQTIAQVAYDGENIYFAFLCRESRMDKIGATRQTRDSEVWHDDSIEIFIDPEHNHKTYYHFIVNSLGTQYDSKHDEKQTGKTWNGNWRAAASTGKNFWTVEAAIPLKALGVRLIREGNIWGLNLNRERHIKRQNYSSWSCTFGGFHNPKHFGDLVFRTEALPYLEVTSLEAVDLKRKNFLKVKLLNPEGKKMPLVVKLEMIWPKGKKNRTISREIELRGKEKHIEFKYRIKRIGIYNLVITLLPKGKAETYYRTANLPVGLTNKDFIREWLICGPFPNPGGRTPGETAAPSSESEPAWEIDFLKEQGGEEKIEPRRGMIHRIDISSFQGIKPKWEGNWPISKVRWTTHKQKEARIDLTKLFEPKKYVLGYAACYLKSDKEEEALIKLGSDDGYKLWFNHQLIVSHHIHWGSKPDQNSYPVHLKKGRNILLLKIDQDFGGFNFYLRLTDLQGKPLILPQEEMK